MSRRLGLLVLAWTLGCARGPSSDQQLLAAIGTAQALMHQADELEARGEHAQAIERARAVLDVPFPPSAPEREDVRLDAWGRIGELELAREDDVAAERALEAGLREVTRASYFGARLHVVRGRVHRERASRAREAADADTARRESETAIEALERSIAINAEVLGLEREGAR